jgi:hypothetical protein
MNRRTTILFGALLLLVAGLIFLASAPRPSGPWTPVSVAFLGYTNGPTSSRCAVFSITNSGNIPVSIAGLAVELEEHPNEVFTAVFSPLPWPAGLMKERTSQTFAIVEPAQPDRWRVGVRFSRHTSRERLREYATNHRWPMFSGWVQQYSTNSIWLQH